MHDVLPLLVKSMIVKSVPAAAPPLPSEMRKFEAAQAAVPAYASRAAVPLVGHQPGSSNLISVAA